jgi:hypothetical protein
LLVQAPTADDIFNKLQDALETVGIPARSWRSGGVARSILGAIAQLGFMGTSIITDAIAGNFLAFGKGDYLTAHAKDVYDIDRIVATFAYGTAPDGVTLTNTSGALYTIGADEFLVSSSITGARYRVPVPFVLGANTSISVDVVAIESGSASSVAPGEIDTVDKPLTGVTVTNPTSIIGRDEETDADLVIRCKAKKGTWSQFGPRSAYEFAALSAELSPGVPTTINRVAVSKYSSTGQVTVVCATPTGTPSSLELAAVVANVEAEARPDTVQVTVSGATTHPTSRVVTIWAKGGTASIIQGNAAKALADMIATYPIGGISKTGGAGTGFLFAEHISAIVGTSSAEIFSVDLSDTSDLSLGAAEVAVDSSTFIVRVV